jgi:hypothetical protein
MDNFHVTPLNLNDSRELQRAAGQNTSLSRVTWSPWENFQPNSSHIFLCPPLQRSSSRTENDSSSDFTFESSQSHSPRHTQSSFLRYLGFNRNTAGANVVNVPLTPCYRSFNSNQSHLTADRNILEPGARMSIDEGGVVILSRSHNNKSVIPSNDNLYQHIRIEDQVEERNERAASRNRIREGQNRDDLAVNATASNVRNIRRAAVSQNVDNRVDNVDNSGENNEIVDQVELEINRWYESIGRPNDLRFSNRDIDRIAQLLRSIPTRSYDRDLDVFSQFNLFKTIKTLQLDDASIFGNFPSAKKLLKLSKNQ